MANPGPGQYEVRIVGKGQESQSIYSHFEKAVGRGLTKDPNSVETEEDDSDDEYDEEEDGERTNTGTADRVHTTTGEGGESSIGE